MNSIYTWGSNRYKQTSTKDELHVYSPACYSELENLAPSVVAAGDSHTLVLTDYGEIYSFGRGIFYQIL
jgi:alpha-tubulin suppressor-like RCC1 family protein